MLNTHTQEAMGDITKNNFEVLRKELGLTNRDFAKLLGVPEQTYSRLKKGKQNVGPKLKARMQEGLPDINMQWLLFNEGDKNKPINVINLDSVNDHFSNGRHLGYFDEDVPFTDIHGNNIFYELSPGRYLMKTKLVTQRAKAGYLLGYGDPEYIDELPSHTITVNEVHKGKYRSFEVEGDSMDDDSKRSIADGYIVTGRLIEKDLWQYKLHIHKWNYFVFVTKTEGIIIKEVIKHNVEEGVVTLHSLNPDKEKYPDFELKLSDVNEIYNIVDINVKL